MRAALISLGSTSSKWTFEAMKKYFDSVDSLNIKEIEINVGENQLEVLHNGKPIKEYDCIYAKGSFRYQSLLQSLSSALYDKTYMPIKPDAFTIGHDKLLTQLVLQKAGIPCPKTYIAATPDAAKKILEKINYPIVMKFPSGTQGKGVMFADSFASASSMLDALTALRQPFLIQEYVETGGVDTRAIVIGDKVVASMKRKAVEGEKRANIHRGAIGEACELDYEAKRIAIKAAQAVGAEICAVDMLEGVKGYLVIEINLSPGLQGITKATKIDVADEIAKYLYKRAKDRLESKKEKEAPKVLAEVGVKKIDKLNQIISTLDFRGNRILLPDAITNITKFNDKEEVVITAEKGRLEIKKFDIKKEKST